MKTLHPANESGPDAQQSAPHPSIRIPLNKPYIAGSELAYIEQAIRYGHSAGDGPFTRRCQDFIAGELGAKAALLTTSCTHALEMAALLLDIQPGDEFIVPSFTFSSTANAFVLRGGIPVFADIRNDTLNLDENQLVNLVTSRTRAIVPVHYAGVACEMDAITNFAARRDLAIIEDNAHGLFARYRGRPLGSFGAMAAQSFHETKNVICGEGGALVINDPRYVQRAEILRDKGTNRSRFLRGEVDKYTWVDVGSSYAPSELLAAFLYAQLEHWGSIRDIRMRLWNTYADALRSWAANEAVQLPIHPPECDPSYHMFYLLLPTMQDRDELIEHLRRAGIYAAFHYVPLHLSPMGIKFCGRVGQCPITESVAHRLIRLPFYNSLSESEQAQVIDTVTAWHSNRTRVTGAA